MNRPDPHFAAGRRLWIGLPGTTLTDDDRRHLEAVRPGGLVAFRRNIESAEQFRAWCAAARDVLGPDLWVTIDQEGGSVVRLTADQGVTVFPGNAALGAIADRDLAAAEELTERQGRIMARELRALGVNLNLAPVIDLLEADSLGIGVRSYGSDPRIVVELGSRFVRGQQTEGVRCCLKHYPGLGAAHEDPHFQLARIPRTRNLTPHQRIFEQVLEREPAVAVMTTHVVAEEIDPHHPATFSRPVIDSLRLGLGFAGPVVTDDLEMDGLDSTRFEETVRSSVRSGHDVLLVAHRADRQQRAAEVIAEEERRSPTEAAATHERLDRFVTNARRFEPNHSDDGSGPDCAQHIADRAVHVARDPDDQLPLGPEPTHWWVPEPGTDDHRCDPLRGESLTPLRSRVPNAPPWLTYDPGAPTLPGGARGKRAVVVIAGLRESEPRRRFVEGLAGAFDQLVVVLTGDPRDLGAVPASATVIQGLGFRPVHQRAIADRLFGA